MVAGRRTLASLTPVVPPELVHLVEDLGMALVVPSSRDAIGVRHALRDADIVLSDWSGALALTADEAAAAEQAAVVLSPGVGVESIDLAAWAERVGGEEAHDSLVVVLQKHRPHQRKQFSVQGRRLFVLAGHAEFRERLRRRVSGRGTIRRRMHRVPDPKPRELPPRFGQQRRR